MGKVETQSCLPSMFGAQTCSFSHQHSNNNSFVERVCEEWDLDVVLDEQSPFKSHIVTLKSLVFKILSFLKRNFADFKSEESLYFGSICLCIAGLSISFSRLGLHPGGHFKIRRKKKNNAGPNFCMIYRISII